jgi:hypothetical protein
MSQSAGAAADDDVEDSLTAFEDGTDDFVCTREAKVSKGDPRCLLTNPRRGGRFGVTESFLGSHLLNAVLAEWLPAIFGTESF